jgi:hypothetical protein
MQHGWDIDDADPRILGVYVGGLAATARFATPEDAAGCGLIIEASPEELAKLPFNPVYADVRLVPANGAGEGTNRERGRGWTK